MAKFGIFKQGGKLEDAYKAEPRFYQDPQNGVFGVFALTEDTLTLLPKHPEKRYLLDRNKVLTWKLTLVSLTKDSVLGMVDYHLALKKLKPYILMKPKDNVMVRGLALEELKTIL